MLLCIGPSNQEVRPCRKWCTTGSSTTAPRRNSGAQQPTALFLVLTKIRHDSGKGRRTLAENRWTTRLEKLAAQLFSA